MSEPMCIVYQALNTENGKRYVGATEKGLRVRKRKHLANAKRGQSGKFYTALRKHGPAAFTFSALTECRDFWHALEEERRLIAELQPEYNLTDGGGGVKGLRFSADARARMSAAARKRWDARPPDVIASYKMNKPKLSLDAWRASRHECGRKLREKVRRPVRCLSDGENYQSCADAARRYGISTASVVLYCQGKVRSKAGLQFEYEARA
jgi:group I intron endonuclease